MDSKNTPSKQTDHFCIQPFVNVTTRLRGNHAVCCNISDFKKSPNIKEQTVTDFFNSSAVKQMRQDLVDNKKLDVCKTCHFMENNNQTSHRQRYNEYWMLKDTIDRTKILSKLRLDKLQNPAYAEIHVSNLCNLKCLTCNEIDSSKFHAENKILGISKHPNADFTKFVIPSLEAIEQVITQDLRFLDIRGGETLLIPELQDLLNRIPYSLTKKITLKIQSNGTITPDQQWLEIFNKFKNTKFNISIDAYDNDNHYIRYPSRWNEIMSTIEVLNKNKIKFIVNTVVSNLNILVLHKLFKWINDNRYLNYFYLLEYPKFFRYNVLPSDLLETAAVRLESVGKYFVNKDMNYELKKLIYNCRKPKENNKYLWKCFINEISMRDNYRKNNIEKIIPELKGYIKNAD